MEQSLVPTPHPVSWVLRHISLPLSLFSLFLPILRTSMFPFVEWKNQVSVWRTVLKTKVTGDCYYYSTFRNLGTDLSSHHLSTLWRRETQQKPTDYAVKAHLSWCFTKYFLSNRVLVNNADFSPWCRITKSDLQGMMGWDLWIHISNEKPRQFLCTCT